MRRRFAHLTHAALLLALTASTGACIEDADTVLEPDPVADAGTDGPEAPLEPEVQVDPPRVALEGQGSVAVLTISSAGAAPLTIRGISWRGDPGFAAVHAGRNALLLGAAELSGPDGLPPGASIEIEVEALVGPPASTALVIETDDPERPVVEVAVGFPDAPCLIARPMALDFGDVPLGQAVGRMVQAENCGGQPLHIAGIVLREGTDPQFSLGAEAAFPAGDALQPGAVLDIPLQYTARIEAPARGTLGIDAAGLSLQVPLTARAAGQQCPVAQAAEAEIRARVGDVIVLDGSGSVDGDGPDGRPTRWRWIPVGRPEGSVAPVLESLTDPSQPDRGGPDDDPTTPTAVFFVDSQGDFIFELEVADDDGCVDRTRVVVRGCPCEGDGILVQLDWAAADEAHAGAPIDLDLHLLHPNAENWFTRPYDCHYAEPNPDWGQLDNPADNPVLDVDAVGGGPERIALRVPENTEGLGAPYLVGVDYNADGPRIERPAAEATLRVFIDGAVQFEASQTLEGGNLWDAAQIDWPSGDVELRDRVYNALP